ncbi:MAG TPA: MFS transporter [Acetobacteraceae bacterium]|nr:MFS transporter [Acetobacteraceae bacterium]
MPISSTSGGVMPPPTTLRRVVIAATIGNVLEWFDFTIYGFLAVVLAQVFFPTGDGTVSLLVTFGAFGLAYLVRPLGAIFVGSYTDKHGRKAGLTLSIALMMLGTTLMALTPGYATIGLAAPILITLARLLQGFSVGGEFGSSVAFLMEHGSHRKGFAASWQFSVAGLITALASLFGVALNTLLSHDQLLSWGWRLPYIFGMLVGPAGLYIRSRLAETQEFLEAKQPEAMPIRELLQKQPLALVLGIGASIISNSSFYILLYIPTYGQKTLHLPAYTGFVATLIGGVVLAVCAPLFGHWSDKMARPRIMVATAWLFVLTSWPCFFMMASWPTLASCIFACAWLQLLKAGYSGVLPSLLGEQFPVATRAIGVSLSFSTAVTIFGGFAPLVATWLIAHTGDPKSPGFYLVATAAMSAAALAMIQMRSARQVRAKLAATSA